VCANGRNKIGNNRDRVVPRPLPSQSHPTDRTLRLSAYEFLGRLMGLALRSGSLLALSLPSIVWKHIVSQSVTQDDVRAIDISAFHILDTVRHVTAEQDFISAVGEITFQVYNILQQPSDLVPGGGSMAVTWQNRDFFAQTLTKYRLSEFEVQSEAMRRGLATVVPIQLLSLLTWQELETRVTGGGKIDVDLLESAVEYRAPITATDPHCRMFWRMLRDRFDDEQRAKFVTFVWGRSRLPSTRQGFGSDTFKIMIHIKAEQARGATSHDSMLPVSHTCFFALELPRYSSLEIMTNRMLYAINYSSEIDGDDQQAR